MRERRRLFFGLVYTKTHYDIEPDMVTITSGLVNQRINSCQMYKIESVELRTTFLDRRRGLGTVICRTSDLSLPKIELRSIKNADTVFHTILRCSEEQKFMRVPHIFMNIPYAQYNSPGYIDL